ncbi:MAG: hypothetical protein AAB592_05310 [Patescibacteria group bacterium]
MSTKTKILSFVTFSSLLLVLLQSAVVLASSASSFSQTISDGSQTVDIVDAAGVTVGSPSVSFSALSFGFTSQTATGTLGASAQRIRVYNPSVDATWTTSVAATSGVTALWTSGGNTYDFNDSGTGGSDDADADTKGGRLTVDPSVGTVAGVPDSTACSPSTGITKGSSASYQEVAIAVSSITLLTGGGTATTYCRWDFTGISLSQVVPASQPSGTYTLSFTITIA